MKRKFGLIVLSIFLCASPVIGEACFNDRCIVASKDNTLISYTTSGRGKIALIFVHGWSTDSRYWQAQVPYFSKKFKVVTIDLAGHGYSGTSREEYTMQAFGEDIKAVVNAIGVKKVILIGHSMGGVAISEAAVLMPERVLGLVGVDAFRNVEQIMTPEEFDKTAGPLVEDFSIGARNLIKEMFTEDTNKALVEWVSTDVSSADPDIALNVFNAMFKDYTDGHVAQLFDDIIAPVRSINSKLLPTDEIANRRHMYSYKVTYMDNVGHFPMLEEPRKFNRILERTIREIIKETR